MVITGSLRSPGACLPEPWAQRLLPVVSRSSAPRLAASGFPARGLQLQASQREASRFQFLGAKACSFKLPCARPPASSFPARGLQLQASLREVSRFKSCSFELIGAGASFSEFFGVNCFKTFWVCTDTPSPPLVGPHIGPCIDRQFLETKKTPTSSNFFDGAPTLPPIPSTPGGPQLPSSQHLPGPHPKP